MVRFFRTIVVSLIAALGLLVVYRWFDEPVETQLEPGFPEESLSDEATEALIKELEAQL